MPPTTPQLFEWKGLDSQGQPVSGQLQALDTADVRRILAKQQHVPLHIKKSQTRWQWRSPNLRDVALFSRQLSILIAAEVPIVTALQTLANGGALPRLRPIILQLHAQITAGSELSDAFALHPKLFDQLYISLIRAGENSGQLDQTLQQLSVYLEDQVELRAQLRNAMRYPLIVMIVALSITAIMLTVIVPVFADMFSNFNADLPLYTQYLLAVSGWLQRYGVWLVAGLTLAAVMLWFWQRQSLALRAWLSRRLLAMPGFGRAIEQSALSRFTGTVATLYAGGVPLPDTLELAAQASGNHWYAQQIQYAADHVRRGATLGEALQQQSRFDATTIEMTRIGEDTGRLTELYQHLATYYHKESRLQIDAAKKLIEPIMILLIGGLVAALVLALYLPIITLVTAI